MERAGSRVGTAAPPHWLHGALAGVLSGVVLLAVAYLLLEAKGTSSAFTAVSFGTAAGPRPVIGASAPAFTLVDLDGTPVRLSDYRGRPVWMNFWATWCPPCRAELPEMSAAYEKTRGSGLVLLAISVGEDRATVRNYLNKTDFALPAVLDEERFVATQYAVMGFPTHYLIDRDGVLRDIYVGGLNQRAMLERLAAILSP